MWRGRCCCGEIRYETSGPPSCETLCHCAICRRISAAPGVAWFTVPTASFRFVAGTPRRFRSSRHGVRTFCPTCGTPLTFQSDRTADEIDVTTCSLEDVEALPPRDRTWSASMPSWAETVENLPSYPETRGE